MRHLLPLLLLMLWLSHAPPCRLSPGRSNTPGPVAPAPECVAVWQHDGRIFSWDTTGRGLRCQKEEIRKLNSIQTVTYNIYTGDILPPDRGRAWWARWRVAGGQIGWSWSERTVWTLCLGPWKESLEVLWVSLCRSAQYNKSTGWHFIRTNEASLMFNPFKVSTSTCEDKKIVFIYLYN